MVSSFRRVLRGVCDCEFLLDHNLKIQGWMVISREAPWLIIIHYLCKRLAKPGCQVETMTNFNEETYSNWPQFLGWSSIRMIWYLVCVYCKPCCGIWTYCCVDAFVSSNVCQQCFGILQFDELNWINYRFILLGCWFQIPLKPFECSMLARMVISIWQISHQYNTAVLIWFSWVESIWHQPYLILSMSMIEAPKKAIRSACSTCWWATRNCRDGVYSAPGRPTGATRRELESCSIWAPKMVEAPTKYPSQWGTDGKVWETDVWPVDWGHPISRQTIDVQCIVLSTGNYPKRTLRHCPPEWILTYIFCWHNYVLRTAQSICTILELTYPLTRPIVTPKNSIQHPTTPNTGRFCLHSN